jgi:hypothetical protein
VRHREQPGVARDPEGLGELLRPAAGLVVRQPEADDAVPGEAAGQPGSASASAGLRVRLAAITSPMPTPVTGSAARMASSSTSTVPGSPPLRAA